MSSCRDGGFGPKLWDLLVGGEATLACVLCICFFHLFFVSLLSSFGHVSVIVDAYDVVGSGRQKLRTVSANDR